jgi:hypothetical protein
MQAAEMNWGRIAHTHTHLLGSERELDCTRVSNSKLICLTLNYFFLGVVV